MTEHERTAREEAKELSVSCHIRHHGFPESERDALRKWQGRLDTCCECVAAALAEKNQEIARLHGALSKYEADDVRYQSERSALLARVETLREALDRKFVAGTRVTNCVVHAALAWDRRPRACDLCATDITNMLSFAVRVNEWLNTQVSDARAALAADDGGRETKR